jgi:hypothetical protein
MNRRPTQTDTDVSVDRINKMYRIKPSRCEDRLKVTRMAGGPDGIIGTNEGT